MIRKEWIAVLAALMLLVAVGAAQAQEASPYRLGIGLGVPYGILGVNAEMKTDSQFAPTVGVGYAVALGWSVGTRYYLDATNVNVKGNPMGTRLTLLYGTNGVAQSDDVSLDDRMRTGVSLGFGKQWEKWNLDLMLLFPMSSAPAGYTESGGAIGLSFGYMF